MKSDQNSPQPDYDQPVAYDTDGRPLYAHPPRKTNTDDRPSQQVVQMTRPFEPVAPSVSGEAKRRNEESRQTYPMLNLSDGEHVIREVKRHPIGLVVPLGLGTLLIAASLSVPFNYDIVVGLFNLTGQAAEPSNALLPALLFSAAVGLVMFIAYYVYVHNKFFLTNESVIQEIQLSLFSRLEQTVSLANIEDASYTQKGIIQQIFNYGSVRLSTEGDETTYRFTFVSNPKNHIDTLNNAVEAFKNGRPVVGG